jgi:hypothetical protein
MGLSRLSKQCKRCPFVDTCENKRMEALAYIEPSTTTLKADSSAPLASQIIEKHDYRDIKIDANIEVTIDLEYIKKQLGKAICTGNFKI